MSSSSNDCQCCQATLSALVPRSRTVAKNWSHRNGGASQKPSHRRRRLDLPRPDGRRDVNGLGSTGGIGRRFRTGCTAVVVLAIVFVIITLPFVTLPVAPSTVPLPTLRRHHHRSCRRRQLRRWVQHCRALVRRSGRQRGNAAGGLFSSGTGCPRPPAGAKAVIAVGW